MSETDNEVKILVLLHVAHAGHVRQEQCCGAVSFWPGSGSSKSIWLLRLQLQLQFKLKLLILLNKQVLKNFTSSCFLPRKIWVLYFVLTALHLKGQINLLYDCSKFRSELELQPEPTFFYGSGSSQKRRLRLHNTGQETWDRMRETGCMIQEMWDRRQETGDVSQETWDMTQETGDLRITWDRKPETGDVRQETWDKTGQEAGDSRCETGDVSHETWDGRRETGVVRQETWDRRHETGDKR